MAQRQIADFDYQDILGGSTEGITRRDPSPVIYVGGLYYVWYSRTTVHFHGYSATIWYATSTDGYHWTEISQALARGGQGAFDEHAVLTPSIFMWDGRYYLSYTGVAEPFYDGSPGHPGVSPTAIGLAVADTPDGPWKRVRTKPVFKPSTNPALFDSLRVDDTCFIIRNEQIWMYYKGRQVGRTPAQTKMGLAIAQSPKGPYVRVQDQAIVDGGHEVCVWPVIDGVASLQCDVGLSGNTIQHSSDGIHFQVVGKIKPPKAPGPYRTDHYFNDATMRLGWGIATQDDPNWPWLVRFEAKYKTEERLEIQDCDEANTRSVEV